MAKARMLHGKISRSLQVNKLTQTARLLYTWMIPHADDEGRLRGEAEYVKATVFPMSKISFKKIDQCLEEIKNAGLIYRWQVDDMLVIQFRKWKDYQKIRGDRFQESDLPSFQDENGNPASTNEQPDGYQETEQYSPIKSNAIESSIVPDDSEESLVDKADEIRGRHDFLRRREKSD